eukprot:m.310505 g.310505  ORF g.310505 m.310505 type:complete len:265 (+) comp52117_c0_seq1:64-858(+)
MKILLFALLAASSVIPSLAFPQFSCSFPDLPNGDIRVIGASAFFSCHAGYSLVGPKFAWCSYFQNKENVRPRCIKPTIQSDRKCSRKEPSIVSACHLDCEDQLMSARENFTNVARGKPTKQSSIYSHSCQPGSEKAVDGNTNGVFFPACSTTHTKSEKNPWWEVELTKMTKVHSIFLFNRLDCCRARLSNFDVLFFDGSGRRVEVIAEERGGDVLYGYLIEPPIKARRIRVVLRTDGKPLSLAEVEVYGQWEETTPEPEELMDD